MFSRFRHLLQILMVCCILFSGVSGNAVAASSVPQHEAGAIYVSVLNAIPFQRYVSELSPKIEYSFAKALEQVAKNSSTEEYASRDALAMTIKLGLTDQGGASSDLVSSMEKPTVTPSEASSAKEVAVGASMPPMLHYSAASALYQEIKLLERSVMNASLKSGYTPYIVRAQVSVMPFKRDLPIDVYSTLSFFEYDTTRAKAWAHPSDLSNDLDDLEAVREARNALQAAVDAKKVAENIAVLVEESGDKSLQARADLAAANAVQAQREALDLEIEGILAKQYAQKQQLEAKSRKLPMVVPLIVSENLELESFSRSSQIYREYGLALMAAFKNLGIRGDISKVFEELRKQTGTDYNALLTTGRLTDNSIRVRLGAMRSPNGDNEVGYEMVPRNHTVSCLLFVPDGYKKMSLVANTQMRDQAGNTLAGMTFKERNAKIIKKLKESILPGVRKIPDSAIYYFYGAGNAVQANDWYGFTNAIDKMMEKLKRKNNFVEGLQTNYSRLWTEVATLVEGGQMAHTSFELISDAYKLPSGGGKHSLKIGENHLSAEIVGANGLSGYMINAILEMDGGNGPLIPANEVKVLDDGSRFVAFFDSPKKLGLPPRYIGSDSKLLVKIGVNNTSDPTEFALFPRYIKTPEKPKPVTLAVKALPKLPLVKDSTEGTVVVDFSGMKVTVSDYDLVVRVDEADEKSEAVIKSEDKESKATLGKRQENGWRKLSGNGRFHIALMNLYNGQKFSVEYALQSQKAPKKGKTKEIKHVTSGTEVVVVRD